MTTPLSDKRIDQLIADYLAGSLYDGDRAIFEDWLRASPDHPRRVARLSATDYAMREVCQDTRADYLLDLLNQIDDAAGPAQLVTLHHIGPSWHRYRLPFAIGGAVAAVLLIAVTLILTLQGPTPEPSSIADAPSSSIPSVVTRPEPVGPGLSPTVATLTAERDAKWDRRPGEDLYAGQRFTLTAGIAEITTNDGAVAILNAPATIELLDNDNALRLHAGKLVGICETESSKGFLVRTPQMDITDLGTRFGVVADPFATELHVFDGAVQARRPHAGPHAALMRITAEQSAIASVDRDVIVRADYTEDAFADLIPRTFDLIGTGKGLRVGAVDPNWSLTAIDGKRLEGRLTELVVSNHVGQTAITPNDPGVAQWLSHPSTHALYVYTTMQDVPEHIQLDRAVIEIHYHADNTLKAIDINGSRASIVYLDQKSSDAGLRHAVIELEPGQLRHGLNTIDFEIANSPGSRTGLIAHWRIVMPSLFEKNSFFDHDPIQ